MDRKVRVRRVKNSPFTLVYSDPPPGVNLEKLRPNFQMTRIWLGVVPPQSDSKGVWPAYACVLGEVYDRSNPDKLCILLDEAVALNPADFQDLPEDVLDECGITEVGYRNPTPYHLRQAIVTLKDVWWPSQVLVPKDDPDFYDFILRTDGLTRYDDRRTAVYYRRKSPLFMSKNRTCNEGVIQVEREYYKANASKYIDGMAAQRSFEWFEENRTFGEEQAPNALRCVSMVLSEMQWRDSDYIIDSVFRGTGGDGYAHAKFSPEQLEARGEAEKAVETFKEMFGG